MDQNLLILCQTAVFIGFVHTILGPDHYVPFVAMARARRWTLRKTMLITTICGIGHVLGSVLLGAVGIAIGIALFNLEEIEAARADLAGWLLIAFGLVYFIWGARQAIRNKPHTHLHVHPDGTLHSHEHVHSGAHLHVHDQAAAHARTDGHAPAGDAHGHPSHSRNPTRAASITPWVLFTVFLFGPCESLIPLLLYPAAKGSIGSVVIVVSVFGAVTLATMTSMVLIASLGMKRMAVTGMHRYSHAAAGLAVVICGAALRMGL